MILSNDSEVLDTIKYKDLEADISVSKVADKLIYSHPSPNKENEKGYTTIQHAKEPIFLNKSGFYKNSFNLVKDSKEDEEIYYTTDGSTPTKKSKRFNSSLPIDKTQTIKFRSFKDGVFPSRVVTNSYIFEDINMPLVSLSIDERYLYDDGIGIYTKGTNGVKLTQCVMPEEKKIVANYARDSKRAVNVEYFDEDGTRELSFGADISITGQCSRAHPQKSFKIDLDKKYGQKSFDYRLFESKDIEKFRDFKLRVGKEGYYILDMLAAALVESGELNIDY